MDCRYYIPDAEEDADTEYVYDGITAVSNGFAGTGNGSGQGSGFGSGFGSGTGRGYETPFELQVRTAKLCINTATHNFGPSQCYGMSTHLEQYYGSYGSHAGDRRAVFGSTHNSEMADGLDVHDEVWETCITKGYDVWIKAGGTGLESDFTDCAACQNFGLDGRDGDASIFCLSKVRLTGGDCSPFDCLGFDSEEAQATCLSVADYGDSLPNECAACHQFVTPQLQRYCLFVSDHDCTDFDCEPMADTYAQSLVTNRRLNSEFGGSYGSYVNYHGNGMGKASYASPEADWMAKFKPHVTEGGISIYARAAKLAEKNGDDLPDRVEGDTKDSPYMMCRQRIWDTNILVPQEIVTPHSCSLAVDLSAASSPIVGVTKKLPMGTNMCGHYNGAEDIYFIDLAPGETLEIAQVANDYDSMHSLRFGGDCPGEHKAGELSWCVDDPDTDGLSWTNDQLETTRAYFSINSYKELEGTHHHMVEYSVTRPMSVKGVPMPISIFP